MSNFIKLTLLSGTPIRVNMDTIESYGVIKSTTYVCKSAYEGKTYLCPMGCDVDEDAYVVKESPEEIDDLLEAKKND